jgi:hypothetical protein
MSPVNVMINEPVDEPGDGMGTSRGVAVDPNGFLLWTSGGLVAPRRRDQQ